MRRFRLSPTGSSKRRDQSPALPGNPRAGRRPARRGPVLFNRERAERMLQKHGLDALVASSPDNVMYASDYECSTHWINKGFQVYSVFSPGCAPEASLIAPSLELEAIVDGDVWIDDVY